MGEIHLSGKGRELKRNECEWTKMKVGLDWYPLRPNVEFDGISWNLVEFDKGDRRVTTQTSY